MRLKASRGGRTLGGGVGGHWWWWRLGRRDCVTLSYITQYAWPSLSLLPAPRTGKHRAQQTAGERGGLKRVLVLMRALCRDVRLAK